MKKRSTSTRRRISILVAACLMVTLCGTAMAAYSFYHTFYPPHSTSLKMTGEYTAAGSSVTDGYVTHNTITTPTSHCLVLRTGEEQNIIDDIFVTTTITNFGTVGTRYFTYKTGYGGNGETYYMVSYPTPIQFQLYSVSGTWNP